MEDAVVAVFAVVAGGVAVVDVIRANGIVAEVVEGVGPTVADVGLGVSVVVVVVGGTSTIGVAGTLCASRNRTLSPNEPPPDSFVRHATNPGPVCSGRCVKEFGP